MQLGRALAEKLGGAALELQQFARRDRVAAAQRVDFDAELHLAAATAQDAHGELVVVARRRKPLRDEIVALVAHVADLAAGQVELALGTHLVLAQLVDDRNRKLQVHGSARQLAGLCTVALRRSAAPWSTALPSAP